MNCVYAWRGCVAHLRSAKYSRLACICFANYWGFTILLGKGSAAVLQELGQAYGEGRLSAVWLLLGLFWRAISLRLARAFRFRSCGVPLPSASYNKCREAFPDT